jgi:hypothetical protein
MQRIARDFQEGRQIAATDDIPRFPTRFAYAIHLIDPRELHLGQKDIELMKKELEDTRPSHSVNFSRVAVALKEFDYSAQKVSESDWQWMHEALQKNRETAADDSAWAWNMAELAANMRILDPSRGSALNEGDRGVIGEELNQLRRIEDWNTFADMTAHLKILDPSRKVLTKEDWAILRNHFKHSKEDSETKTDDLTELMANLKILAAKSIRIGERGIELDMTDTHDTDKTPSQPEALAI